MEDSDRLLKQSKKLTLLQPEHLPRHGWALQVAVGLQQVYLLVALSQSSGVGNPRILLRNQNPSSLCTGHPTISKKFVQHSICS